MKFLPACKEISQLSLTVAGVFCSLSILFVGIYLYVDHLRYLSSYHDRQQTELKEAQGKISSNIENLKQLSVLTGKRVSASLGKIQQIQNILVSTPSLLPDKDFFKIQKVAYEKHSPPSSLITRFGTLPFDSEKRLKDVKSDKNPSIFFDQDKVCSKICLFTPAGQLEGILEIYVALSHFKETLKIGSTLSFVPGDWNSLLQKEPFPIYGKAAGTFLFYLSQNIMHYVIFFLFFLLSVVFIIFNNFYSRFHIRKNVQEEIEDSNDELAELQHEMLKANETILTQQKRIETHQVTCQAYKQFQTSLSLHQKEKLKHALRSLDVVAQSLQNPNTSLPQQDLIDILKSCLSTLESVSSGTLSVGKQESVSVKKVLANIRSLFTEKMYKSDLTLEIHCPEGMTYYGDFLLLELMLLNLIGKPLYMAPKNGKVFVKVTKEQEGLHIQVIDNGFAIHEKGLKQIQHAFDLFISDDQFLQLCHKNGFLYERSKDKDGLNTSIIVFLNTEETSLRNNVVSLFNKR